MALHHILTLPLARPCNHRKTRMKHPFQQLPARLSRANRSNPTQNKHPAAAQRRPRRGTTVESHSGQRVVARQLLPPDDAHQPTSLNRLQSRRCQQRRHFQLQPLAQTRPGGLTFLHVPLGRQRRRAWRQRQRARHQYRRLLSGLCWVLDPRRLSPCWLPCLPLPWCLALQQRQIPRRQRGIQGAVRSWQSWLLRVHYPMSGMPRPGARSLPGRAH